MGFNHRGWGMKEGGGRGGGSICFFGVPAESGTSASECKNTADGEWLSMVQAVTAAFKNGTRTMSNQLITLPNFVAHFPAEPS